MVQCFPVTVCRFSIFLNQSSIYSYRTVFITGRTPCARTGYSVIIFLSHNGGFKRAFNLYTKFIDIPFSIIFYQRRISILVNDQFKGQSLIACGCDGNHITTFQDRNNRAGTKVFCRKFQSVLIRILSIGTTGRNTIRFCFPGFSIYLHICNGRYIVICIFNCKIPSLSKHILRKVQLT